MQIVYKCSDCEVCFTHYVASCEINKDKAECPNCGKIGRWKYLMGRDGSVKEIKNADKTMI